MEIIKADCEVGKILPVLLVRPRNQLFRRDPQFVGIEHDGRAMGVVGTDVGALVTLHSLEADPYIGLNIFHG